MLAALDCQAVDHPPCCFMQFTTLERRCRGQFEMVEWQLAQGLDATVQIPPWLLTVPGDTADLRGLPVQFHPEVQIREWKEQGGDQQYARLAKEYQTPAGPLTVCVNQTSDWPYGDHVPFLDDFIIPRARKPLLCHQGDLDALRYLLQPPSREVLEEYRAMARQGKALAKEHDLLVSGGLGAGADMAGWLCGLQPLIYLAVDEPGFVEELLQLIADWNLARMAVVLEAGVDLWVRRGWYEGSDFWSPRLYRRFILPHLKAEVELAHNHGVRFGYIMTSGAMPLLDMIVEAGIDVLIGVDPLQGGTDLRRMSDQVSGEICLWGGVNGPVTVEGGSTREVQTAVTQTLDLLAPQGGLILSPVDDVEGGSERAWRNVQVLIEAWKEWPGSRNTS